MAVVQWGCGPRGDGSFARFDIDMHTDLYIHQAHTHMCEHVQGVLVLASPDFILSMNGMLFGAEGVADALLALGHALRGLIERERGGWAVY
jgi:hypothetical protein